MAGLQTVCDLCGDPTDGYCCQRCADSTGGYLQHVINLAGEVETTVARLARYAVRGSHRAAQLDDDERPTADVHRRQLVETFGWPASKDRPRRGALRTTALPVDLNASARAAQAFDTVTTWARRVEAERGLRIPDVHVGDHAAAVAAFFLRDQLGWVRHQPFADEALTQLSAGGAVVRRIVDSPPEEDLVGVCDCGAYLYARRGRATVRCACGLNWDVQASRETLIEVLRDRLVTVAEAATLGVLAYPDLQRDKVRKLVQSWVRTDRPNHMIGVEGPDGWMYPFGDILDRLSRSVVRFERSDRVNVTA